MNARACVSVCEYIGSGGRLCVQAYMSACMGMCAPSALTYIPEIPLPPQIPFPLPPPVRLPPPPRPTPRGTCDVFKSWVERRTPPDVTAMPDSLFLVIFSCFPLSLGTQSRSFMRPSCDRLFHGNSNCRRNEFFSLNVLSF